LASHCSSTAADKKYAIGLEKYFLLFFKVLNKLKNQQTPTTGKKNPIHH